MNETNPQQLQAAIKLYKERYPTDKGIDMFKLDDIIEELKKEK